MSEMQLFSNVKNSRLALWVIFETDEVRNAIIKKITTVLFALK